MSTDQKMSIVVLHIIGVIYRTTISTDKLACVHSSATCLKQTKAQTPAHILLAIDLAGWVTENACFEFKNPQDLVLLYHLRSLSF